MILQFNNKLKFCLWHKTEITSTKKTFKNSDLLLFLNYQFSTI